MSDLRKLAAVVLLQAVKDGQRGDQEAREWLLSDDSAFPFWCAASGLNPARARRRVKSVLERAPLSRQSRREPVLQALRENPHLSNREIGRRLDVEYETVRRWRLKIQEAELPLEGDRPDT